LPIKKLTTNCMSKEKTIKQALAWVIRRGYSHTPDSLDVKSMGLIGDYKDGIPGFTQLYAIDSEDFIQPASFTSVDEIYVQMLAEPNWN